jgi:hypothetical protein
VKRVEVKGAAPRSKGDVIEPVEIAISGYWPFSSKDELSFVDARFEADAQMLFDALRQTLPGGTFDRLLVLMLKDTASHFIVAHSKPKGDKE